MNFFKKTSVAVVVAILVVALCFLLEKPLSKLPK